MLISARVHYACLALLELAVRSDESTPVAIREITDRHDVPGPFLVQILRSLRTAGWVQSIRGSQGGYRLAIDPSTVTMLDIAELVGGQDGGCRVESKGTPADDMLQEVWDEAGAASRRVLAATTLADLVARCGQGEATMFYI